MTDSCQLEGRTLKWQLAYFGPKVGYFGHIFKNPVAFVSQEFSPRTAAKIIMEKY